MNTKSILFSLLRSEVCEESLDVAVKEHLSSQTVAELYALSKRHDLAHIVGNALSKLGLLGNNEISKNFKQVSKQAVYRYVRMNREYCQICKALETAQIPFIPLKGAVLREWYPEPWQRTSCDIDILVKPEDLDAAIHELTENYGYRLGAKMFYDVSLYSPNGLHLELHFDTLEEQSKEAERAVLGEIWNDAKAEKTGAFRFRMSDEMFYFFHIAHMAKHLERGGCGIKPFLDLWILNHRIGFDPDLRKQLLSRGELLTFAQAAERLSEVWFSGKEEDSLSSRLESFVLDGGVYGTIKNTVAVDQTKAGSKLKYLLSKVFLSYDILKYYYPILKEYPWLTPFYEVRRWMRLVFTSHAKRSLQKLKANSSFTSEEVEATAELFEQLGLI